MYSSRCIRHYSRSIPTRLINAFGALKNVKCRVPTARERIPNKMIKFQHDSYPIGAHRVYITIQLSRIPHQPNLNYDVIRFLLAVAVHVQTCHVLDILIQSLLPALRTFGFINLYKMMLTWHGSTEQVKQRDFSKIRNNLMKISLAKCRSIISDRIQPGEILGKIARR